MLIKVMTCGPNEAFIVSGVGYNSNSVIQGGRLIFIPCLQKVQKIDVSLMTITVKSTSILTRLGVPISVTGTVQIRVNATSVESILFAAELYANKSTNQLIDLVKSTMECHQRGIIGTMSVEEIIKDKDMFSEAIVQIATKDILAIGVVIVSYTIKEINDDNGYMEALGTAATAEVKCDATIGEFESDRDLNIARSWANQEQRQSELSNQTEIARAERDYLIKSLKNEVEVSTAKVDAELAYELKSVALKQQIQEEAFQVKVIERTKDVEIAMEEALRMEKELKNTIIQPAQAEKYRMEALAKANASRVVSEANATAESIIMTSQAKAFSITKKAEADALQLTEKAEAWKQYGDAAVADMVLKMAPEMMSQISSSISNVKKISIIGGDGKVGSSNISQDVLKIFSKAPALVEEMTGIKSSIALGDDPSSDVT